MMKKLSYSLAIASVFLCSRSAAQNFNPTVEVTNTYQSTSADAGKPLSEMAVPDSLLRFDLDYDYQVFEKKYDGSYSFKPYMLNMTPEKNAYRGRRLYLKAGAGYSLHPVFDLVFAPTTKGGLDLSFFASHKSYFGNYAGIGASEEEGVAVLRPGDKVWKGYDALTRAGFDGHYNWNESTLTFGAGYYGLMTRDTVTTRGFHALDFNARMRSTSTEEKFFFYDFGIRGRFASERSKWTTPFIFLDKDNPTEALEPVGGSVSEGIVALEGTFGPVLNYFSRAVADLDVISASYGGDIHSTSSLIALTPKYELETGRWKFSLGLRLEALLHSAAPEESPEAAMGTHKGKIVYPAVNISFTAADNVLLTASATGGATLNPYSSLIEDNHHISFSQPFCALDPSQVGAMPFMDNSVEVVNGRLGVRGNLWKKLQFDIAGGFSMTENGLLESGIFVCDRLFPSITYQDYNTFYADALFALDAGKVRFDAGIHYRNMVRPVGEESSLGLSIPALTADARLVVDINSRVYAGLNLSGRTSRKGSVPGILVDEGEGLRQVRIPGYLDVGLLAGYQINRRLGVWAQGGNLLCETLQRNVGYAEKGPWGTVGITLNL